MTKQTRQDVLNEIKEILDRKAKPYVTPTDLPMRTSEKSVKSANEYFEKKYSKFD